MVPGRQHVTLVLPVKDADREFPAEHHDVPSQSVLRLALSTR